MSAQPKIPMTHYEYLEFERASETKHEFWNGTIYAMAGASRKHVRITSNIHGNLFMQLRESPCEPFASDLRLRIGKKNAYVYPDVMVACGEAKFDDSQLDTLLNPTLIVEVLSESTDRHDRVTKLQAYRNIDSLRDYLLVSQDSMFVERYTRQDELWLYETYNTPEAEIALTSVGCVLRLADIYARIEFEPIEEE